MPDPRPALASWQRPLPTRPAFVALWATGPDTATDGVFRVQALRPAEDGGWESFANWARPFDGEEDAGAPLNQQGAWVTEFGRPGPAASIDPPKPAMEITTYPNPAKDYFSVEFQMEHSKDLNISLYDSQGRFVKTFYDFEAARDGLARFTFSTAPLAAGIYFIHIEIDGETTSVGQVFVTK